MAAKPAEQASVREFEIKFDLSAGVTPALEKALAGLGGEIAVRTLRSTYYDTAGADLAKAGFSLRLRDDGRNKVQTLKRAGRGAFDRGEWESPAHGPAPDLDAAGFGPVRDILDKAGPLSPRLGNRIERRQRTVERDGAVIEIALDQGETEAGGRRAALAELELELKAGDPLALFALARALSAATPLRLSFETKAARARSCCPAKPPPPSGRSRRPSCPP